MGPWFPCRLSSLSSSMLHCDLRAGKVGPKQCMFRAAVSVGSISEHRFVSIPVLYSAFARIQTFDGRERGGNKEAENKVSAPVSKL